MNKIALADKKIGLNHPPFIVAEMSGNHNQSLEKALEIVYAAYKAGVHALKLQTYTADTITIDDKSNSFFINDSKSLWKGKTLYELYKEAYTPWEWHKPIFERCRELGLIAFSTPFDETAVDFLEDLNVPAYKIASFENIHLPLIKKVALTGKPLIISAGMASIAELDETVRTAHDSGCKDLVLLKCTSTYPAFPEDANLLTIPHLRQLFKTEVGLSDHTSGIGVSIASVALGATVIEKHFTLSRALYHQPELLILDEATSALDSESERYIQKALQQMHGHLTIIVVAHRLSTIREADIICYIENCEVKEEGSHEKLMQDGIYYKKLKLMQIN